VLDYERNYADKGQAPQGLKGKVTQSQTGAPTAEAIKSTKMDETATLLAAPRGASAPPHNSPLKDQDDIPTRPEGSSPAPAFAYQAAAASPGPPAGTEISQLEVKRPAQPAQRKRRWMLAAGAVGLLLAGTAAGAILFSRPKAPEGAPRTEAAKVETPTPTLAPAPAPSSPAQAAAKPKPPTTTAKPTPTPVEKMNYKLAQSLEQQERYDDAANVYEDYLARNPNAPDANIVGSYLEGLRRMQGALNAAESAMNARMYPLARKHYQRALTLRPDSQRAKAGLDDAEAKIKSSLPPRMRRESPSDQNEFPRGAGGRQRRPGQEERQEPSDQPPPARIFRRVPRPTPTPRERYP